MFDNEVDDISESSFNHFHLKSELIRAIHDKGYENPSEGL